MFREADTPIQRHIKIKADANPHDPKWARYFEFRWGKKMLSSSRGRMKLYRLWLKQGRLCPYCQKPIKRNTPWETRFRVKGRWQDKRVKQPHYVPSQLPRAAFKCG